MEMSIRHDFDFKMDFHGKDGFFYVTSK